MAHPSRWLLLALALSLTGTGCGDEPEPLAPLLDPDLPLATEAPAFPYETLPQGWDAHTRERFWFTSQGSQLIPYDWFLVLEEAGSTNLFRSDANMEALRYLPSVASRRNPDALPIGFARDDRTGYVGFTCAACHTGRVDYEGQKYLIEGGPTLGHFNRFLHELVQALVETHGDDPKFDRFAQARLGAQASDASRNDLREELDVEIERLQKRLDVNRIVASGFPADHAGFGRLDAFQNIFNQITAIAMGDDTNRADPDAPVSYPFLWGAPQSDRVQWNGQADNTKLVGPLGRNVAEVIGVFGKLEMEPHSSWKFWTWEFWDRGYATKIDFIGLGHLESLLWSLRSPRWQDTSLPGIDTELAEAGETQYMESCSGCHPYVPREQESHIYDATLVPATTVGTDPRMATNVATREVETLWLEGERRYFFFGEKFPARDLSLHLALHAGVGAVLKHPLRALLAMVMGGHRSALESTTTVVSDPKGFLEDALETGTQASAGAEIQYKARPLTGIWATAPYFHNGSVPNLAGVLDPSARPGSFWVGARDFDEVGVGYVHQQAQGRSKLDASIAGNGNGGHTYAAGLTPAERKQLLEFLKTL